MTVGQVDEAMQSLHGYGSLAIHGKDVTDDVMQAIISTSVVRTIAAVPTLALVINDPHRTIVNSGVFGRRTTVKAGDYTYEVAQFSKSGPEVTITCEDQTVAELREHNSPIKVAAGKQTFVEFARSLVNEVNWIDFVTDPAAHVVKSKEALMRGDPTKKGKKAHQSTWDCITGLASARGWRCFVRGVDQLLYVPDSFLFKDDPSYVLTEGKDGVDVLDFDYDKGKKVATMTATVRVKEWAIPPGVTVLVKESGPANGKWLVQDITRALTDTVATVTLTQPEPVLPEPVGSSSAAKSGTATVGTGSTGIAPKETTTHLALDFVNEALSQRGKAYVFGSQTSPSNNNPTSFDCSLLVEWAAGRVGVALPRTAEDQFKLNQFSGTLCSVEHAIHTRGAVLYEGDPAYHTVISLGNGKTIEARGKAYGVNEFGTAGRPFSHGALVVGLTY